MDYEVERLSAASRQAIFRATRRDVKLYAARGLAAITGAPQG